MTPKRISCKIQLIAWLQGCKP